jgi:hypothetical protein
MASRAQLDIPATCNAHGASETGKKPKWTAKHSAQLTGADIVVFNDNDPAGYAHADAICKLSRGVAKLVRRLDLKDDWPDIPKGDDVSDWLSIGGEHTAERLKALIEEAPDYADDGEESDEKPERIPQRDKIIKAVRDAKVTFWRDADGEAYATVPRDGHTRASSHP